jgi:group II intron maturase
VASVVLGFTVKEDPVFRLCIADKAMTRFKDRVREPTRRHRGVNLEKMIADLNPIVRGGPGTSASASGASCHRWIAGSDDPTAAALRLLAPVEDAPVSITTSSVDSRSRKGRPVRRLGPLSMEKLANA